MRENLSLQVVTIIPRLKCLPGDQLNDLARRKEGKESGMMVAKLTAFFQNGFVFDKISEYQSGILTKKKLLVNDRSLRPDGKERPA